MTNKLFKHFAETVLCGTKMPQLQRPPRKDPPWSNCGTARIKEAVGTEQYRIYLLRNATALAKWFVLVFYLSWPLDASVVTPALNDVSSNTCGWATMTNLISCAVGSPTLDPRD